jgi:Na+-driven multidrug efflux pump
MLITPISIGLITRILAGFGEEAVAAFGVASRVEMFALMVIAALGSVMIIFTGQNLSKHKFRRIIDALKIASRFSILWGILIYGIADLRKGNCSPV